jgi:hypothetical protein
VGSSKRQALSLASLCVATLVAGAAHARDFDTWSKQLANDRDFKVRLSAGLRLGQLGDRRAVPVLTKALGDDVATVRIIAASALAKVINKEVPAADRARALEALKRQMTADSDGGARKAAKSAVAALERVERIAKPRSTKNGVFVQVERLSDTTKSFDQSALNELTALGRDSLLAANGTFLVDWPGGKPTRKQLKRANARAVVVLATVTVMDVTDKGKRAEIECKLNLILASYPQKAARTFVDGTAKLETSNRAKSIERAKTRCAMDIVKHLMGSRLARDVSTTAR